MNFDLTFMSILIFFIVLFLLVLVHELGHFLAAKKFGIRVDEFGIGFPPKIFGKKYGETEYTFNWLPIGGFVRIFGENPDEESIDGPDRARSFVHKPKWQQAIVLVAGVTFNVLFAWLLITTSFIVGIPTEVDETELDTVRDVKLLVMNTLPDSPAMNAGLEPNDEIIGLRSESRGAVEPLTPATVSDFVAESGGEELTFVVNRAEGEATITVTPELGVIEDDPERAATGFHVSFAGIRSFPVHEALWEGTKMTWNLLAAVTVGIMSFFYDAFTFQADFTQVAGPVGIVGLVGDASALGFAYLVTFTALISLNLAVINMLPFPALDGGRLVFVLIEKIKGSPINPKVANRVNLIGFALLILLMIAVTYNDIIRIVTG